MGQHTAEAGYEAEARQDVFRLLNDAAGERRNGLHTTDAGMLTEHLVDALTRLAKVEGEANTEEDRHDEKVAELEGEANCGLSPVERRTKTCRNDDCLSCRLVWAAMEKDCGADDATRDAELCVAAHLGIDRCCECKAHLLKIETDGAAQDAAAEIARLTTERDAAREANPTAEASSLADSIDQRVADAERRGEANRETLLREIEGLNNRLQIVTQERDAAIVEAQRRPVAPAKNKPAKAHEGRSLFDLLRPPKAEPVKTPRVKGARKVKRYPTVGAKVPS